MAILLTTPVDVTNTPFKRPSNSLFRLFALLRYSSFSMEIKKKRHVKSFFLLSEQIPLVQRWNTKKHKSALKAIELT